MVWVYRQSQGWWFDPQLLHFICRSILGQDTEPQIACNISIRLWLCVIDRKHLKHCMIVASSREPLWVLKVEKGCITSYPWWLELPQLWLRKPFFFFLQSITDLEMWLFSWQDKRLKMLIIKWVASYSLVVVGGKGGCKYIWITCLPKLNLFIGSAPL